MSNDLTYQVKILQNKNRNSMLAAIGGMVAAFFATAVLPSLLIQYLYAGKQLLQVPPFIEYIQVGSFVLGFGYFLYALVANMLRAKRINYLLKKMELDGFDGNNDRQLLAEMKKLSETIVKGAKKSPKKKSTSKKSSAKKSSQKKSKSKK